MSASLSHARPHTRVCIHTRAHKHHVHAHTHEHTDTHTHTRTDTHTHVHTDMLHYMQIQGEDLAADKLG